MALRVRHTTPQGHLIEISHDALGIAERVGKGDGIMWEGDPRMHVAFDGEAGRWQIRRIGEDGIDRLLVTFAPEEWDHRVFRWLVEHDTRRVDVLAKVDAANASLERSNASLMADVGKECDEFLAWANERLPSHEQL